MYYINKKNLGENSYFSKMSNNSLYTEKLNKMKERYIANERELEMNKHRMTTDQVLANILVLSLEKRVYLEKEAEFLQMNKEEEINKNNSIIKKDYTPNEHNLEDFSRENFYGVSNNNMFFEPIISNTNQTLISDMKTEVNWSKAINKVDSTNNLSCNIYEKEFKSIYEGKVKYRPFVCEKLGCKKRYTSLYGLKYHEINGHNKVYDETKPFKCPVKDCEKRYKNLNGLRYHQDHGHKI